MTCDHVTILAVSDWLNQAVTAYQSAVADWCGHEFLNVKANY